MKAWLKIPLAIVVGLVFLVVGGAALSGSGLVTGACTVWFDGSWKTCCDKHDGDYTVGVPKRDADLHLAQCVSATGHPGIGLLMLAGVTVFGPIWYADARSKG